MEKATGRVVRVDGPGRNPTVFRFENFSDFDGLTLARTVKIPNPRLAGDEYIITITDVKVTDGLEPSTFDFPEDTYWRLEASDLTAQQWRERSEAAPAQFVRGQILNMSEQVLAGKYRWNFGQCIA